MPRGTRAILAALAGSAVIVLAGCASSRPTKAQYTADANAICRSASTQTTPLLEQLTSAAESLSSGGQTAARELTSALQKLHTAASSSLAKLRALEQPAAGHAAIERFLSPFATVTEALGQAAKAASAGQPQQALTRLAAAASASRQMTGAARAYGITQCEIIFAALATPASTHAVHATLAGENHDPTVNQPWHYTVTVTGAQGNELSGTETTQYTYDGVVVGTEKPENVAFTGGVYHDTIEFPAAAVGYPLEVQAVIHVSLGSVTLDWPVEVRR